MLGHLNNSEYVAVTLYLSQLSYVANSVVFDDSRFMLRVQDLLITIRILCLCMYSKFICILNGIPWNVIKRGVTVNILILNSFCLLVSE